MKNKLLNLLYISIGVTIFGLLLDDDPKESSTKIRFMEFFLMTFILFILISIIYLSFVFVKNRIISMKNK
jgi:uncharacterized membrane protein YwaF